MRLTVMGSLVVVGLAGTSRADVQPEPATAPAAAFTPHVTAGVGATVWFPGGDIDQAANTSLGIRPTVAYSMRPGLALLATFDWVFVDEKANSGAGDVTYYAVSIGGRASKALPSGLEPYGELLIGYHKLEANGVDDGGIGFRLGGGVMYPLAGSVMVNAGIAGSTVSIDAGFFDVEVSALVLELGLGARF